jgi:hypothetical protein
MERHRDTANALVFRAISRFSRGADRPPAAATRRARDPQELPTLDLVGAAIARAARIAAAEDRGRFHLPTILASQAAGLLKPTVREMNGLFADLPNGDGRVVAGTSGSKQVVWRLHPAPATTGAAVASPSVGAINTPDSHEISA